jgi:hypothetical protein
MQHMKKFHPPAPIPFIKKVRSSATTDGSKTAHSHYDEDNNKSNYASFSFYISNGGEEENTSKAVNRE